ncbi:anthranilate synthase family protein [Streptomyces alkaliterrae]|uniref:anthranilate synthase n=1 Tax=Streptomyces alkaliterrae TaxID=2213162 RepID=A0A5P0YQ58_9ACTN|nr:anthranilate synthase family protein [Streptomyces alkaliterrae]MBB1259360.1 phenazine-specific anthranilate synthase [Streptomyces alkaliterrae]MQS01737.1 phenazine-specific anthranilate synthase component I [Streptomyces alkaliterrae]
MPPHHSPADPAQDTDHDPADHDAAAALRRLGEPDAPPFALLHRRAPGRDESTAELLVGTVRDVERLAEIPVDGPLGALALVPFRQIREQGLTAHDDGTPLSVLLPHSRHELPLADLTAVLPDHRVDVREEGFDLSDAEYESVVRRVVDEEIATGEGANFVVRRTFHGVIDGYTPRDALALFRRLLAQERGAYWTFVVHTGDRTLVGASPEAHVRMTGGTVVMNPISGTHRYPPGGPTVEALLDFLADRKETEELSMVVDEELKMMCAVGDRGGVVVGPRLKEMAHLAHTEYELRGRSTLDPREVLRRTMFAATVTGSPLENACRVIRRHERTGRGYYSGALALFGRDAGGAVTLDSPIVIRTAEINASDGRLRVGVGATLVRGSDPAAEVAETHAKAAGVLAALGVRPGRPAGARDGRPERRLAEDPRVVAALAERRSRLSPFWLQLRDGLPAPTPPVDGATRPEVLVVDGEDTFTAMLAHLLRSTGPEVTVLRHDSPDLENVVLAHPGPVVLGPGPGDPTCGDDPKMRRLRRLTGRLLAEHRYGLLGVCLGHELIAAELGLELVRTERPRQGAQMEIDYFGRRETVGFYSSFVARCDDSAAAALAARGVELGRDGTSGEVYALRGPGVAGTQFHPESVLSPGGARQLAELLHGAALTV